MSIAIPAYLTRRRTLYLGSAVLGLVAVSGTLFAITRDAPIDKAVMVYELASTDVITVQPQALTRTLRLSGTLTPLRHAVVKSRSMGAVLELRVDEGDRVRAGALLARIDPRNLQAELDARTAALRKAQADLLLASKNRDNSVALLKQKLISQNAFDQTEAAFAVAQANEEAAQAQVRLAQIALEDTEIRADFDGVVAARHVQVGERVMPDSALLSLVDLRKMQLEALVPVADVPTIEVGQVARFTVDGFPQREFTGQVERINPQTEQGTRSLTVYLTVANTDGVLKGGMFADGDLMLEQTQPKLALPSGAIHTDAEGAYVLALKAGVVERATVNPGQVFAASGVTVVEQGIDEGMQVIVAPATTLKAGAKAKVM
jgi:membrane fusion protein (multidrug efflux system)